MSKNTKSKNLVLKENPAVTVDTVQLPKADKASNASYKTISAENIAMATRLAEVEMERDNALLNFEKANEGFYKEITKLEDQLAFAQVELEAKNSLLAEITDKLTKFAETWKELRGKPWKRFISAVGLLGDIMDTILKIIADIKKHTI